MKKIILREDVPNTFLDTFDRYQETKRIYYINGDDTLGIKDEYYIDEWDFEKKKNVIEILRYYLSMNGSIVAVTENEMLLGFAALNGKFMGDKKQYLNLGFIHVSKDFRGKGIGKLLFSMICKEARNKGAVKLYIGANPSVDTIKFYQSIGCKLADEIVEEVYKHEPMDLQLEYRL